MNKEICGQCFFKVPKAALFAGFIVVFALLLPAILKINKKGKTSCFKICNQIYEVLIFQLQVKNKL